jgi:hypothetical protein
MDGVFRGWVQEGGLSSICYLSFDISRLQLTFEFLFRVWAGYKAWVAANIEGRKGQESFPLSLSFISSSFLNCFTAGLGLLYLCFLYDMNGVYGDGVSVLGGWEVAYNICSGISQR